MIGSFPSRAIHCIFTIMKFEVYKDEAGEYRFRLKSANGEILAVGEGYANRTDCFKAIARIKECFNAPVVFV